MDHFSNISAELKLSGLDAVLVTSHSNRLYATGFQSSDGAALVVGDRAYFIVDSRYTEAAANTITGAEIVALDSGRRYAQVINSILQDNGAKKLGFEESSMSYSAYLNYEKQLEAELCPAQDIFTRLRMVKSPDELDKMRQAQAIAEKAFNQLLGVISTDMTETEAAAELLYLMLKNGADDKSFSTILVSGEHSSMPHGVPENRKIQPGFLTIDFGAKYKGYCSDTTRTICIGKPTDQMREVYETVLRAQEAGIAAARGGIVGKELDAAARKVIDEAGYGKYFGHSFGHSLGIDVHEAPNASPVETRQLPVGCVVSAEPGIYLPGEFGVRIEDVLILTENGCEDITHLDKNLIIL